MSAPRRLPGFTLMELLLVLGIIAILASIVIIAINPTKQLEDARNVDRSSSMREIENAISQYIIDGNTLTSVPANKASAQDICRSTATGATCTGAGGYDLEALTPTYLIGIPVDPNETDANLSGYRLYRLGSFYKICAAHADEECGA